MKKFLVGMLAVLLVLTQFMLPVLPSALAAAPTDITGNWAEAAIMKLVNLGYIAGYPDGTYKPDNSVTRAEFVKIITGVLNYPEPAPAGAQSNTTLMVSQGEDCTLDNGKNCPTSWIHLISNVCCHIEEDHA